MARRLPVSEVTALAMIMAERGLSSLDATEVSDWWNVIYTEDKNYYRRHAREFLSALRKPAKKKVRR